VCQPPPDRAGPRARSAAIRCVTLGVPLRRAARRQLLTDAYQIRFIEFVRISIVLLDGTRSPWDARRTIHCSTNVVVQSWFGSHI